MGGRKGKAPQRLEGPKKLASGEQKPGSASAEGLPSGEPQKGQRKARGARPELEPVTMGGQGTLGGRRKPKGERNSGSRRPAAGPPPTQGRQGSARRGGCEPNSREPGDSRAGRQKEESLPGGEGKTGKRSRLKRRGKGQGPSAPTLDGDTSGGDLGSSCPDSEAHEHQESGSQSGGDPELWPNWEQKDTGSGGTQTGSESALEPGELASSDGQSRDEPSAGPRSLEGSSETGTQGTTEDSGADTDSGPEEPGPGRGPRASPGLASTDKEAQEAKLDRKATAPGPLDGKRTCVLQSSRAAQDPKPAQDTSDKEVQREAGPGGAETGGAQASSARTRRRHVGKVVGRVQAAAGESEAGGGGADGPGDPAPLAALVGVHRLCARPPPGPTPQAPGPRRANLKERFLRVAQALNLLRWLWHRLRSSSSQAAKSPARNDPSEDEDPTPDPKFAVVFPRIHRGPQGTVKVSGQVEKWGPSLAAALS
ncbi:collagen alpha-1(I) chain-like [Pteropus medius]|uniref:collagen alpha-1(I) chain-like n=1 Tax=Pteropus vampyrus TaxID=132908 RepID=UPI00196A6217|nr:collagen alpha-1(I) chain-like [Pteropus giganteus]